MSDDRSTGKRGPGGGSRSGNGRQPSSRPGFSLGRPFGIPVFVAPSSLGLALLIMLVFAPGVQDRLPELGAWSYVVTASFAVLLIGSVLLHELAHSIVATRFGLPVRRIVLQLLGGASELEREPETPWREFAVAVVGPLVSLALGGLAAILGAAIYPSADDPTVISLLVIAFAGANIIVGVFNLLPGLPLDGGRALRAIVWGISRNPRTGTIAAGWGGRVVAAFVLFLPYLYAAVTDTQPDLVNVVWTALIASFIWMAASATLQQQRIRDRVPLLHARTLTRRAIPVHADLPVSEALRQARDAGARGLVVVDSGGSPTGLVNESSVTALPEHRRPWVTVATVARSIEPGLIISVDLTGEELVRTMQKTPASEYLVIEDGGNIYGVLATTDVERAFASAR